MKAKQSSGIEHDTGAPPHATLLIGYSTKITLLIMCGYFFLTYTKAFLKYME